MTVLSDRSLKRLLFSKKLVVHPILSLDQIKGSKIDLRLGNILYVIKHFERPYFDPRGPDTDIEYGDIRYVAFDGRGTVFHPGDFAMAPLLERVRFPPDLMGRLDGRSSLGRLGIEVHATAGGIDPGFSGQLTCELSNLGKVPVKLYPLMRIAALTVEEISTASDKPYDARRDRKYGEELGTSLPKDSEFSLGILDEFEKRL
jgi:dCTP deaminase